GRHYLARLTIPALHHVDLVPGLLYALPDRIVADLFYRDDILARSSRHGRDTRAYRLAVHMHGTGAAQCDPAAKLGSRQARHIAYGPQQRHVVRNIQRRALSVYRQIWHIVSLDGERQPRAGLSFCARDVPLELR